MVRAQRIGWFCAVSAAVLAWVPGWLTAFDRTKTPASDVQTVDLLPAIEAKQIEVRLFPKDSTECNVLVTNKTDKPLSVRLPQAFAGVPVLAQFLPPGNQPNNQQNAPQPLGLPGTNNNRNLPMNNNPLQGPGGPMNVNPRNQRGLPFNQPGLWNIAPEKVGKFKLPAVCLEHGAPNPRPQMAYQVKPLESVTSVPGVAEVCATLGRGGVSQKVAQLAAWRLANDLSWEKIAGMRQKAVFGTTPTYKNDEVQAAKKLVEKAVEQAKPGPKSGTQPSSSETARR